MHDNALTMVVRQFNWTMKAIRRQQWASTIWSPWKTLFSRSTTLMSLLLSMCPDYGKWHASKNLGGSVLQKGHQLLSSWTMYHQRARWRIWSGVWTAQSQYLWHWFHPPEVKMELYEVLHHRAVFLVDFPLQTWIPIHKPLNLDAT